MISDVLSKIDGLQIRSIAYSTSKDDVTRREALKRSLVDAHDKAADLAEAAHCHIDRPWEIQEEQAFSALPGSMNYTGGASADTRSGTPAALPGQIEIDAKVIASYDLTPN